MSEAKLLAPIWLNDSARPLRAIEIPWELTNGNAGRTRHFRPAHREAGRLRFILRQLEFEPIDTGPVWLLVCRVLAHGQSRWDADSWQRGNLKEMIDAAVSVGWINGDSPAYLAGVSFCEDTERRPPQGLTVLSFWSRPWMADEVEVEEVPWSRD